MREFVIYNVGQRLGKHTARKHNEIAVSSSLIVTGYGDSAAIVFGFEFPHRWFVADQKYLDREFRKFGIAKYQRADELVEMLEFSQDTLGAVFARGRFHDVGFRADLNPGKE